MTNYVYVVVETEVIDYGLHYNVWVYETLDKAKSFLGTRTAELNREYAFYDEGSVVDDCDTLFSWTKNIGFEDNVYEISIEKKEVE